MVLVVPLPPSRPVSVAKSDAESALVKKVVEYGGECYGGVCLNTSFSVCTLSAWPKNSQNNARFKTESFGIIHYCLTAGTELKR